MYDSSSPHYYRSVENEAEQALGKLHEGEAESDPEQLTNDNLLSDPLTADRYLHDRPSSMQDLHRPDAQQPGRQQKYRPNTNSDTHRRFDFSDTDANFLESQLNSPAQEFPHNLSYVPHGTTMDLTRWEGLQLDDLGFGWSEALRGIPVNRQEAFSLIIILKKKLLRAGSELVFYKERVALLQNQMMYQRTTGDKLKQLQNVVNKQAEELQKLRNKLSRTPALEDTVRQQQDIISRLERILEQPRRRHYTVPQSPEKTIPVFQSSAAAPDTSLTKNALRDLTNENEELRQTIAELNRTVRSLAEQQQDDNERQRRLEERHREEMERLRDDQERLLQRVENQKRETETNFPQAPPEDNEKLELRRQLEAAEQRIRRLEDELAARDQKTYPEPPLYNRRRDAQWKPASRFPTQTGPKDRMQRRSLVDYARSYGSEPGLVRPTFTPPMQEPQRTGLSNHDFDWLNDGDDF